MEKPVDLLPGTLDMPMLKAVSLRRLHFMCRVYPL
jgi:hypothetical protein